MRPFWDILTGVVIGIALDQVVAAHCSQWFGATFCTSAIGKLLILH